jgi:hypothetical protein
MRGAYGKHCKDEKCIQDFGKETQRKESTLKT